MAYNDVFGGTTIQPAQVGLLAVALSSNITLEWPFDGSNPTYPATPIIDVTCSVASSITLPDASVASPGQSILFNSLSASVANITVKDAGGSTIATIAPGEQWQVYLAVNTTTAGTWRVLRFGASTATVQASALAGAGLTVITNQLAQSMPATTFNSSPRTLAASDRASAFVWTGTGAATVNLPAAATAGSNYFVAVRNGGGGDVTVDPDGSETIDDASSLTLQPGESTFITTDGLEWFTVGLGRDAVFAFDFTSINVAGSANPYTLSGAELNRVAYKFTGLRTANIEVVVPKTVQQYWVDNSTTGAYTLKLKTSGGTPVEVTQGARAILYCDGSEVRAADTGGISTPVSAADGGTGQSSYAVGDLIYASNTTVLSRLADVATGNALISGGVGVAPAWGKIGLTTHVSGALPVANGGTALTGTPANGQLPIGNGTGYTLATLTDGTGISITEGAGTITVAIATMTSSTFAGLISDETGSGSLVFGTSPVLTSVRGVVTAVAASTVDCATANYFTKTASGNITWVFSNAPSGEYSFVLRLTNGGAYTMTWPASVDWPSGTAPTLTASGVDVLGFITDDSGTTWRGVRMMRDSR